MPPHENDTCWTLIRGAAGGRDQDREEFARRYLPTVRAYLSARWREAPIASEIEDVIQEVFIACFREGGVLDKAESQHQSGFRGLLYGVTKNVALHAERTRARRIQRVAPGQLEPVDAPAAETSLSRIFDREYARTVMRTAREHMEARAARQDESSQKRVELLRLRFEEGKPIREIAKLWNADATRLHREYAKAAKEFKVALGVAVTEAERCPPSRLEAECERLLGLLRR